ncbi:hypothetical protein RRG08_065371 [Elysia crispata]|uniref:Uncharacterized protein n=1 Tax=Elysia crispata TaxID=231223 RepID=A0AAE1AGG4_9GAST|nr:hypothetical protein RRG08_065371 [Elysia crispata]
MTKNNYSVSCETDETERINAKMKRETGREKYRREATKKSNKRWESREEGPSKQRLGMRDGQVDRKRDKDPNKNSEKTGGCVFAYSRINTCVDRLKATQSIRASVKFVQSNIRFAWRFVYT